MSDTKEENQLDFGVNSFPIKFLVSVFLISISPALLNVLGLDLGCAPSELNIENIAKWHLNGNITADRIFAALSGNLHHLILEWSSVMVATTTIFIAFSHFSTTKDVSSPIIGAAILCSGFMDAFHTLASVHMISTIADHSDFIPFTWTLTRTFNVGLLMLGAAISLNLNIRNTKSGLIRISFVTLIFILITCLSIYLAMNLEHLPQFIFPHQLVSRPYDIIPLTLFTLAFPIFWKLYKKTPNFLTASLIVALIPHVILELHMVFGSSQLFDNDFNIAHALKIVAYLVPFLGFILDYIRAHLIQEQTQEELAERRLRLQAVLDEAVDGIITIDSKGVIESFNAACIKLFDYSPDEVIGKNINTLMPEPYRKEHDQYLRNYHSTGDKKIIGIGREVSGKKKDGTIFPIELSVSQIEVRGKRIYSGIVRDISARKESENQLKTAVEDLQQTNQELESFAYVASHDLKSPLRAIDNLAQWLDEDLSESLDDENRNRLKQLRGRVLRLENLLDDLLEFSKGGQEFDDTEIIRPDRLIEEVKEILNIPNHIKVETTQELKTIKIPRMPLEQIFQNLISNAVKHNDKKNGHITISGETSGPYVEFRVSDNGPGIEEKFHEKIFEMFQTLRSRDDVEGSGMGLALVKKILYRFGGKVRVESEPGKGATFFVYWPLNPKISKNTSRRSK